MLGILKKLLGLPDDETIKEAIEKGAFLVDVRTAAEFAEGSVKGAINIPLNTVNKQIDRFKNKGTVVVFCQSGGRSGQAKSILEKNGITPVINGGGWENVREIIS